MSLVSILQKYLLSHFKLLFTVITGNFLTVLFTLATPYLMAYYIDNVLLARNAELLYSLLFVIAACFVCEKLLTYTINIYFTKLQAIASFQFNLKVINHLQCLPLKYFEKTNTVYLNQRINNDTHEIISFLLGHIVSLIVNFVTVISIAYILYGYNHFLAWLLFAVAIIYSLVYKFFKSTLYTWSRKVKEQQNSFFAKLHEQLGEIKFIKTNALESYLRAGLVERFKALVKILVGHVKISWLFSTSGDIVRQIAIICILLFGGMEVINGNLSLGKFVVINSYFMIGIGCITYFLNFGQSWQETKVSLDRVNSILDEKPEESGTIKIETVNRIDFSNVCFAYASDRLQLENFTYSFCKGKIYCLVGDNGSGKSTFLNMLIGLLRPQSGNIFYDGMPFSSLDINHLRRNVAAFSEQEPVLLADTIQKNLLFGLPDAQEEKLDYWLEHLGMKDVIAAFPDGMQHSFDENTDNISGGEKQKLSQIRTFLKNTPVLILDEPTSALDKESVVRLQNILLSLKSEKIIIIVTHHLLFRNIADEIIHFPL